VRSLHGPSEWIGHAFLSAAGGSGGRAQITTIEGLSPDSSHPLQKVWIDLNVPQCGYCQAGMLMAAAALLKDKPKPTDDDIDASITNICRVARTLECAPAIHKAADMMASAAGKRS